MCTYCLPALAPKTAKQGKAEQSRAQQMGALPPVPAGLLLNWLLTLFQRLGHSSAHRMCPSVTAGRRAGESQMIDTLIAQQEREKVRETENAYTDLCDYSCQSTCASAKDSHATQSKAHNATHGALPPEETGLQLLWLLKLEKRLGHSDAPLRCASVTASQHCESQHYSWLSVCLHLLDEIFLCSPFLVCLPAAPEPCTGLQAGLAAGAVVLGWSPHVVVVAAAAHFPVPTMCS